MKNRNRAAVDWRLSTTAKELASDVLCVTDGPQHRAPRSGFRAKASARTDRVPRFRPPRTPWICQQPEGRGTRQTPETKGYCREGDWISYPSRHVWLRDCMPPSCEPPGSPFPPDRPHRVWSGIAECRKRGERARMDRIGTGVIADACNGLGPFGGGYGDMVRGSNVERRRTCIGSPFCRLAPPCCSQPAGSRSKSGRRLQRQSASLRRGPSTFAAGLRFVAVIWSITIRTTQVLGTFLDLEVCDEHTE